jgi:hypothetical protein
LKSTLDVFVVSSGSDEHSCPFHIRAFDPTTISGGFSLIARLSLARGPWCESCSTIDDQDFT